VRRSNAACQVSSNLEKQCPLLINSMDKIQNGINGPFFRKETKQSEKYFRIRETNQNDIQKNKGGKSFKN
jgi:hypothetical protein